MTAIPPHECPRCGYDLTAVPAPLSQRERLEAVAKANVDTPHAWDCSRCAYDLRGQFAARGESARGTCSECGLAFNWFELLTRDEHLVKGFVEHTRGYWKTFIAAWRTWIWTLWPAGFWKRISIERPMRVRRAWLWLFILFVLPRLAMALVSFPAALGVFLGWWGPGPAPTSTPWSAFLFSGFRRLEWNGTVVWAFDRWPPPLLAMAAASLTVVLMLLALPFTLGKAKIHHRHIVRASIYGLSPIALPVCLHTLVDSTQVVAYMFQYWGISAFRDIIDGFADFVEDAAAFWPLWGSVMAVWFAAYWWYVVAVGWRLAKPKPVWGVMMLGAFLAAFSAVLFQWDISDGLARWLF
ncbi:MAG: hypothetical protein PSX37_12400 [bacterium]|nr:hypothetical protein [bacterium]